ncbi:MAG TPA: hypothetical protein VMZ53_02780 [Kofleriaceae bacterium]|nr:hypothetical protein [Kofleriaceae bacterium]
MRPSVCAWLLVAACGRIDFAPLPDAGAPPVTNGRRLHAVEAESDHGSLFLGWYDPELGTECTFRTAEDGATRCLPPTDYGVLFADAGCTAPLAELVGPWANAACARPPYATRLATNTVYRMGMASTQTTTYAGNPTNCLVVMPAITPPTFLFEVGEVIPASAFVAATEALVPLGRLSAVELIGDDDSHQRTGEMFDTVRNERCRWLANGIDTAYCVGNSVTVSPPGFSDAACTQPAVRASAPGSFVLIVDASACPTSQRMVATGPALGAFYRNQGNTCVVDAGTAYSIVDVPPDGPVRASLVFDRNAGAGVLASWHTDELDVPASLFDTKRNSACTPFVDHASKRYVCAPPTTTAYGVYSDAACTQLTFEFTSPCNDANHAFSNYPQPPSGSAEICEGAGMDLQVFDTPLPTPRYEDNGIGCVQITGWGILNPTPLDGTQLPRLRRVIR